MKQIYNFESAAPPVLNENMLRLELKKRKLHIQTAVVALGSLLLLAVVALLGHFTCELYPWLAAFCLIYVIISVTGGSIIAVACTRKGGIEL